MSDSYHIEVMRRFGLPFRPGMTRDEAHYVCRQILNGARVLKISSSDYEVLRELQQRRRWDWPATFSTNGRQIWPFVCYGDTPVELRDDVTGISAILDDVADLYLLARGPLGGRFFLDDHGAY